MSRHAAHAVFTNAFRNVCQLGIPMRGRGLRGSALGRIGFQLRESVLGRVGKRYPLANPIPMKITPITIKPADGIITRIVGY